MQNVPQVRLKEPCFARNLRDGARKINNQEEVHVYQRYRERRRRRRDNPESRRSRLPFQNPVVQIMILLIVALIIFILLSSAGR